MPMLSWQPAARALDCLFEGRLCLGHVNIRPEYQVLMEDVAPEVRVDPTLDNWVFLLWQRWLGGGTLGQREIDRKPLQSSANTIRAEGWRDGKPPKIGTIRFLTITAHVIPDAAFGARCDESI
jgi:hypothetical protein